MWVYIILSIRASERGTRKYFDKSLSRALSLARFRPSVIPLLFLLSLSGGKREGSPLSAAVVVVGCAISYARHGSFRHIPAQLPRRHNNKIKHLYRVITASPLVCPRARARAREREKRRKIELHSICFSQ